VGKAVTLVELERFEEALAACDLVVARYASAPEAVLRAQVAGALFHKGIVLSELRGLRFNRGDPLSGEAHFNALEAAVTVFDQVSTRGQDPPDSASSEWVARALIAKGVALGMLGRVDDAVSALDVVVNRYGDAEAPAFRVEVGVALMHKFAILGGAGRMDEAWATHDERVRFAEGADQRLLDRVLRAYFGSFLRLAPPSDLIAFAPEP
jgi:hypothetical protein